MDAHVTVTEEEEAIVDAMFVVAASEDGCTNTWSQPGCTDAVGI